MFGRVGQDLLPVTSASAVTTLMTGPNRGICSTESPRGSSEGHGLFGVRDLYAGSSSNRSWWAKGDLNPIVDQAKHCLTCGSLCLVPVGSGSLPAVSFSGLDGVKRPHPLVDRSEPQMKTPVRDRRGRNSTWWSASTAPRCRCSTAGSSPRWGRSLEPGAAHPTRQVGSSPRRHWLRGGNGRACAIGRR
jgi:hypothetical protein